ncbi:hypothetical protein PUN28_004095 [Cardiocondyla obscurior]|uniref:Uncharacterized protein n=1 Tax=Cardiocondyla obscurior TaxID=286306 RepID=A0AAW2GPJ3_9HYME
MLFSTSRHSRMLTVCLRLTRTAYDFLIGIDVSSFPFPNISAVFVRATTRSPTSWTTSLRVSTTKALSQAFQLFRSVDYSHPQQKSILFLKISSIRPRHRDVARSRASSSSPPPPPPPRVDNKCRAIASASSS